MANVINKRDGIALQHATICNLLTQITQTPKNVSCICWPNIIITPTQDLSCKPTHSHSPTQSQFLLFDPGLHVKR